MTSFYVMHEGNNGMEREYASNMHFISILENVQNRVYRHNNNVGKLVKNTL